MGSFELRSNMHKDALRVTSSSTDAKNVSFPLLQETCCFCHLTFFLECTCQTVFQMVVVLLSIKVSKEKVFCFQQPASCFQEFVKDFAKCALRGVPCSLLTLSLKKNEVKTVWQSNQMIN